MLLRDLFESQTITEMDMMDVSWATWWLNPQVGDQIIPVSEGENGHWIYVEKHYMDMVADRRGAENIISNYDIFEDDEAFYKISKMVFANGWVRAGYPYQKDLYFEGGDDRSIWLAAKKLMEEIHHPVLERVDMYNVVTNKENRLASEEFDRYLKTGRIPRQRMIAEDVGENLLYHGTLLYKANRILQDKALTKARISHRIEKISPRDLKASKRHELAFSMSRNPNLNYAEGKKGIAEIIFVFRRDVLANNFTIAPFDFAGSAHPTHSMDVKQKEESEEQIYGTRIPVNDKTVAKIIIRPLGYDEGTGGDLDLLRQLAKENNIPVEDTQ